MHFNDNWIYNFFNKEWFVWSVVIFIFLGNLFSPLIIWFVLGGKVKTGK